MITKKHFLLIGNTRLHWADNSQKSYNFFHTKKNYKFPRHFDIRNVIWASVGSSPDFLLKEENEIKTNDINLSNLPNYFGVDRALACLAAVNIVENSLKKNLLIADFGTIFSLTKITNTGLIIGGQLAPGFLTQLKSMEKSTKNLKAPTNYKIPDEDFLMKTEDAMLKGVLNSLIGIINCAFNPKKDILITCGGDSELFTSILQDREKNILNEPNLVLKGMIFHFESLKS